MVNSPSSNVQRLSSAASKLVTQSPRSPLLAPSPVAGRSRSGRLRAVLPQPVQNASLVIPVRLEAHHLAWMLEHITLDATGHLVVPVDADANRVPEAMLRDPAAEGAYVGSEPAGVLQQSQAKLHTEPLG
jgi:hypothetical protein